MDNLGNYILVTQNNSFHIDQLLAQKKIYSNAKSLQGIQFFTTILLPIILALLFRTYPNIIDKNNWISILYLLIASFSEKILERLIDKNKKLAATIQETFDTEVLQIEINETLNIASVDRETIRAKSKRSKTNRNKVESVTNWYSLNLKGVNTNIASILCQRTNIYYDFSVRKRYNWLMRIFVIMTFIILLCISLENDITFKSFLLEVIIPSVPIFMFAYKEINTNTESINNLKYLKNIIEKTLDNINIHSSIEKTLLRKIQDRIYSNRNLSPLIPDLIYRIIRPKLEDEMNYSIEQKLEELKK